MHPTSSLSSGFSSIFVSFLRSIRAIVGSAHAREAMLRVHELAGHPQLGYDDSSRALSAQTPNRATMKDVISCDIEEHCAKHTWACVHHQAADTYTIVSDHADGDHVDFCKPLIL